MHEKIEIRAATKIQSTYRSYRERKTYGIKQIPEQALEDYKVLIQGNDPTFSDLPTHDESIALIGTSGMRSLEIIYKLSAGAAKLIILDKSKQVINFWRKARTIISQTDDPEDFLDQLKNYVTQSQCNRSSLTISEFQYLEKLFNHLKFDKMKGIITTATIIGQSWADKDTLIKVKNILALNKIHTVYAYPSNIVAYENENVSSSEAEKILANIQQLNPVMAIHTDLVNGRPENYFLISDHTPSTVKDYLDLNITNGSLNVTLTFT